MLEWLKLDPQTHIYVDQCHPAGDVISISIMAAPLSVLKREPNMVLFPEKMNRATGLKFGMQTQLGSSTNMGWVPSGHTSSSWYVRLKMSKMSKIVLQKKNFDIITYSLLF